MYCIEGDISVNKKKVTVSLCFNFLKQLLVQLVKLESTRRLFRIRSLPKNSIYIRTWLIPKSIIEGKVKDDYFGKLEADLKINNHTIVAFHPVGYADILNHYNKSEKPGNFIIPIGLLTFFDIIYLLFKYLIDGRVILKKRYYFKGKDVTNIINESLFNDFWELKSFFAYIELFIAKRVKRFNPKIFIYNIENQAWENSYHLIFQKSKTKFIGIQSSGFSYRILNFFPTKMDKQNNLFPDLLLTAGNIFKRILLEKANYPCQIKTIGALRTNHKSINGKFSIFTPNNNIHNKLLYVFPLWEYQYNIIINDLFDVFAETDIVLHFKFHPLLHNYKYEKMLPDNFKVMPLLSNKPLGDIYDFILFNDNSFGIEAMMRGVLCYEYDCGEFYPDNRLFNFIYPNHRLTKIDLYNMKDKILSGQLSKQFDEKLISNYINEYYSPYNGHKLNQILEL